MYYNIRCTYKCGQTFLKLQPESCSFNWNHLLTFASTFNISSSQSLKLGFISRRKHKYQMSSLREAVRVVQLYIYTRYEQQSVKVYGFVAFDWLFMINQDNNSLCYYKTLLSILIDSQILKNLLYTRIKYIYAKLNQIQTRN